MYAYTGQTAAFPIQRTFLLLMPFTLIYNRMHWHGKNKNVEVSLLCLPIYPLNIKEKNILINHEN